jgi:hypothetical protein
VIQPDAILYVAAANGSDQYTWIEALRLACASVKAADMRKLFHPGVFGAKTWSCCNVSYEFDRGCQPSRHDASAAGLFPSIKVEN